MDPSTTEARIQELQSYRKQINAWRSGTVAIIVVTLVVCLGVLYKDARNLATQGPEQQVFVDKLQEGLNERVVPQLKDAASRSLTEMQPVVQKEFFALNKRVPDVTKATLDQVNMLQTSLPKITTTALTETFDKALRGREAEIKSMYPDVTEDQVKTLFDNMTKVTSEHGQQMAQTLLSSHIGEINGIRTNLDAIAKTEPNTGTDTDDWQLGLAVFDVMRDDVKGLTLPKGEAASKIAQAANTISDAAKHVANTANQVSDSAKQMGEKAKQEGNK